MHTQLHEYLEGDHTASALAEELRSAAADWDALLEAVRTPERPLPWLEGRVMHAVAAHAARPAWRGRLRALARPRYAAAVAAVVVIAAAVLLRPAARAPSAARPDPVDAAAIFVQFALEAPGARTVSVTGSFNQWSSRATPLTDVDGDGVWTALVPLGPGVHQYMFVVDEVEWVTDPRAGRYVDDGFGRNNAVIAVAMPSSPAS
jgi:hypothetical protein